MNRPSNLFSSDISNFVIRYNQGIQRIPNRAFENSQKLNITQINLTFLFLFIFFSQVLFYFSRNKGI